MSFIRINLRKLILLVYFFITPFYAVHAACRPGTICNPLAVETIQDFIRIVLEGLLRVGIPIVALAIIYCGFLFVFAVGNSEKLTKARQSLIYTLIGAAILLGSYAIATLLAETVQSLG